MYSGSCFYKVPGVSKNATALELKTAHRNFALLVHPDRLVNSSDAEKSEGEAKMKAINHANDILGDPTKRAKYDASRRSGNSNPQQTNRRTRRSKVNTPKPTRPARPNSTRPKSTPRKRKWKAADDDNDNDREEFFRKRNRTTAIDEDDWEELRRSNESKRTSMPQARPTKKPNPQPTPEKQYDNKHIFNAHGWEFEATISDKYKIISEFS